MTVLQQDRTLRIPQAHNGPRGHANGGFACGAFAQLVPGPATVRLLRMVPLERDLVAVRVTDGFVVRDGARQVAHVTRAGPFVAEPPLLPSPEAARAAREAHPLRGIRHPLSDCVVCGPERTDGLEVTPGPLAGARDVLAAPFVVKPEYARDDGATPESMWGALDCISYPAQLLHEQRIAWLGTLTVALHGTPAVGQELVAVGWTLAVGDRSYRTAGALIGPDGGVVASSRAIWVLARL